MKKILLALSAVAALLLTTACGSGSAEEKKAASSLAEAWNGADASAARKASNTCIAKKWTAAVGTDQLVKDKIVDKNFRAIGQAPPDKMSKSVAKAFGNAVADCFDVKSMKDDLKKSMAGLDDKTVNAYISCMDAIDRDLIAQAVADGKTSPTGKLTKPMTDLQTVVKACQDKVPTQTQ